MTERLKKSNNINHSNLRDFKAWASAEGKSKKKTTEMKDGQAEGKRGKEELKQHKAGEG